MKQACCRPPRVERGVWALFLVVALISAVLVLGGCRQAATDANAGNGTQTASAPAAPGAPASTPAPAANSAPTPAPVDHTETGTGVGQLNVDGGNSVIAKAMGKGFEVKCRENLRNVRAAVHMNRTDDGKFPASLGAISEINNISSCPTGHEPYAYDPETGEVHCTHPGHEKF